MTDTLGGGILSTGGRCRPFSVDPMKIYYPGCFRPDEREVAEVNADLADDYEAEPPATADELEAAHLADAVDAGRVELHLWRQFASNGEVVALAETGLRDRLFMRLLLRLADRRGRDEPTA